MLMHASETQASGGWMPRQPVAPLNPSTLKLQQPSEPSRGWNKK